VQVNGMNIQAVNIHDDGIKVFYQELSDLLKTDLDEVAVDTSAWKNITSSHIHVLWHAYQRCTESGVRMKLASPSVGLIRVLRVLDLYDLLAGEERQSLPELREAVHIGDGTGARRYVDDFGADPESIDQALNQFMQYLKGFGVHEVIESELQLLFYEVATNIRNHSHMSSGARIVFSSIADEKGIVLTFADSGRPYNPIASTADIDVRVAGKNHETRGFGIMMIRKLADKISYVRKFDNMNILILEKQWGETK